MLLDGVSTSTPPLKLVAGSPAETEMKLTGESKGVGCSKDRRRSQSIVSCQHLIVKTGADGLHKALILVDETLIEIPFSEGLFFGIHSGEIEEMERQYL